ncbi:uncharacterized protein LOC143030988 [Oratosquilla oratoria]|uniref:uncharacterized protein LOC143030988 n=1 Tax=Oratosquilla oratoria TaxID=337810 RepID=UPI003F76D6B1
MDASSVLKDAEHQQHVENKEKLHPFGEEQQHLQEQGQHSSECEDTRQQHLRHHHHLEQGQHGLQSEELHQVQPVQHLQQQQKQKEETNHPYAPQLQSIPLEHQLQLHMSQTYHQYYSQLQSQNPDLYNQLEQEYVLQQQFQQHFFEEFDQQSHEAERQLQPQYQQEPVVFKKEDKKIDLEIEEQHKTSQQLQEKYHLELQRQQRILHDDTYLQTHQHPYQVPSHYFSLGQYQDVSRQHEQEQEGHQALHQLYQEQLLGQNQQQLRQYPEDYLRYQQSMALPFTEQQAVPGSGFSKVSNLDSNSDSAHKGDFTFSADYNQIPGQDTSGQYSTHAPTGDEPVQGKAERNMSDQITGLKTLAAKDAHPHASTSTTGTTQESNKTNASSSSSKKREIILKMEPNIKIKFLLVKPGVRPPSLGYSYQPMSVYTTRRLAHYHKVTWKPRRHPPVSFRSALSPYKGICPYALEPLVVTCYSLRQEGPLRIVMEEDARDIDTYYSTLLVLLRLLKEKLRSIRLKGKETDGEKIGTVSRRGSIFKEASGATEEGTARRRSRSRSPIRIGRGEDTHRRGSIQRVCHLCHGSLVTDLYNFCFSCRNLYDNLAALVLVQICEVCHGRVAVWPALRRDVCFPCHRHSLNQKPLKRLLSCSLCQGMTREDICHVPLCEHCQFVLGKFGDYFAMGCSNCGGRCEGTVEYNTESLYFDPIEGTHREVCPSCHFVLKGSIVHDPIGQ